MKNIILHDYVLPLKGVHKKVLYHFSDCHLTEYDELSSKEEKEKAIRQREAWEKVRKDFCDCYHEPYGDNQRISPLMHLDHLLEASKDGDALIMTGDIADYISGANIRVMEDRFSAIPTPFMFLCGNHEPAEELPGHGLVSLAKSPVQVMDLGDLIILGLDNAERIITKDQLIKTKEVLSKGKETIAALHVPIMTEENKPLLQKCGVYFQLNYEGCPKENKEFIELLKNSDNVCAVLAGHLHFLNVSHISDTLIQYTASQGITGNLNRYTIGC